MTPQQAALGTFVLVACATFAAVLARTGGASLYSLDDPYIHLALAERIALHGNYGINAGEFTSPSSSIVWPLLMLHGAGTTVHPWLPLILTLTCGAATAWLLGAYAAGLPLDPAHRATHATRLIVAVLLVLAANLVGLAFTGLEHSLQVLIATVAALGLVAAWRGERVPDIVLIAVAIAPAVRYELFAVVAAVTLVLAGQGRWRAAIAVGLASLVLPLAFSAFLLTNGNHPLPNSVIAKLMTNVSQACAGESGISNLACKAAETLSRHTFPVALIAGLMAVLGFVLWATRPAAVRGVVILAALTLGALHLLGGRYGWFFRYEVYAVLFLILVTLHVVLDRFPGAVRMAVAALLLPAVYYATPVLLTPAGAQNIYEQQFQMHIFVSEHYRKPVAVNDLGWVSYRRDPSLYVLDLYGLASNEAVNTHPKNAAWLDDVTRRHGAGLAIIYPTWFKDIPASWTLAGELRLSGKNITAAQDRVAFYATAVGDPAEIREKLAAFEAGLPEGTTLTITRP